MRSALCVSCASGRAICRASQTAPTSPPQPQTDCGEPGPRTQRQPGCGRSQGQQHTPAQSRTGRRQLPERAPAHPAGAHQQALMKRQPVGPALSEAGVQGLGCGHLVAPGAGAHRQVSDHDSIANHRAYIGTHPVMVPVLSPVFHQPDPSTATLQTGPHVGKGLGRHVWMPNHVVGLPDQLIARETTGGHKGSVGIGQVAAGVGG